MSFYNPFHQNWDPYHQNRGGYDQQGGGFQESRGEGLQVSSSGTQSQGGLQGNDTYSTQGSPGGASEATQGYTYSPFPVGYYPGASPEMQYVMHLMANIDNQLNQLSQLLEQNNQLLQSLHEQGDTKCVQGTGGGAVIVRM